MVKKVKKIKILRELAFWLIVLPVALTAAWLIFGNSSKTSASSSALSGGCGNIFYGDTTNAGIMRSRSFSASAGVCAATWAAEFNGITGSASNILWTKAQTASTREEMMIGSLRVNGTLQIESCTTACDANGDFTNRWANAGTTATQDCDTAPTSGTCVRGFDVAYESLKARAMVAYGDNVGDKFYYALWDGSAWSPDSSPDTPSATNEVDFNTGGTGGTPHWISAIAQGDNLNKIRSDRIMVLISDSNEDLFACYWDGSSFSCTASALEAALQNCTVAQCFDGAWQDEDTFVLAYFDTVAATMRYQIYSVGSGWGGEQNGPSLTNAGAWITATASLVSSRILVATSETGDDARSIVWRGDDATDGWTVCSATGCPDTATETMVSRQSATAFERFSGQGLWVVNTGTAGDVITYSTYTPSSTWANVAGATGATSDDAMSIKAWGNPNNDDIMVARGDVDCDLYTQQWSGAGWDTAVADLEGLQTLSNYGVACPLQTTPAGGGAALNYDFTWKMYTPWQRNWRFYDGEAAGGDEPSIPSTALANENTAPTAILNSGDPIRLRINYAERGRSISSVDERKKLQYTSGCTPNSALEATCTWTDVDDIGGSEIWRYIDIACTATDCADNNALTGTVLTGSSTCSAGLGCATWVADKDAAAGNNMDHTAQSGADTIQETEWVLDPNGATPGTTYYFRIYNVDQDTPVYREQDASDCEPSGTSACNYPSLSLMDTNQLHYRWRNDDGNETGATNAQNEDTAHTGLTLNSNIRLRFLVNNTNGDAGNIDYRLDWALRVGATCDTDETYAAVPDSPTSEPFDMTLTSHYADGAASTNASGVLTDPSGSFLAATLVESPSNKTGNINMTTDFTEMEYVFQANSNAASLGNYCFRVSNNGTALLTYTQYAALQIASLGPTTDQVLRHGNYFSGGVEQGFFWANFAIAPNLLRNFFRRHTYKSSK